MTTHYVIPQARNIIRIFEFMSKIAKDFYVVTEQDGFYLYSTTWDQMMLIKNFFYGETANFQKRTSKYVICHNIRKIINDNESLEFASEKITIADGGFFISGVCFGYEVHPDESFDKTLKYLEQSRFEKEPFVKSTIPITFDFGSECYSKHGLSVIPVKDKYYMPSELIKIITMIGWFALYYKISNVIDDQSGNLKFTLDNEKHRICVELIQITMTPQQSVSNSKQEENVTQQIEPTVSL